MRIQSCTNCATVILLLFHLLFPMKKQWPLSTCSVPNLPRQSANAKAYLCFLVSASAKENAETIEFLGILKKISLLE